MKIYVDEVKLRRLIARKILSIRDFCKLSGVPETTMTRILHGGAKPFPKTIQKIANALECDPEEFTYLSED